MPIRIDVPDATVAGDLVRALVGAFGADDISFDAGRLEVRIQGEADQRLAEALTVVETWLADSGLASVAVHLDEHTYLLESPNAGDDR